MYHTLAHAKTIEFIEIKLSIKRVSFTFREQVSRGCMYKLHLHVCRTRLGFNLKRCRYKGLKRALKPLIAGGFDAKVSISEDHKGCNFSSGHFAVVQEV